MNNENEVLFNNLNSNSNNYNTIIEGMNIDEQNSLLNENSNNTNLNTSQISQTFNNSNKKIIIFLLVTSSILFILNLFQFYTTISKWQTFHSISSNIRETCYIYDISFKSIKATLSLIIGISILIFSICISIDSEWFFEKIICSFLYMNYTIFGPYCLVMCIFGIFSYKKVLYCCDKDKNWERHFSLYNTFILGMLFVFSLINTCLVSIFSAWSVITKSISGKNGGNVLIKTLFWKVVFKNKNPITYLQEANNNQRR
jgi:hypothetical protein